MSNRTLSAMLARGLDSGTASALIGLGYNIQKLKALSRAELITLGIDAATADEFVHSRPPIPADVLASVLHMNRSRCCVCRKDGAEIILHHVKPYALSKDHSAKNLAVLCLEHHGKVHTRHELSRNLDEMTLSQLKAKWEAEVISLDRRAILSLADANKTTVRFDYINHFRIFEMARSARIEFSTIPYFREALQRGLIKQDGSLTSHKELGAQNAWQTYDFGEGYLLYPYVFELVKSTLAGVPIINISDRLDASWLRSVLRSGDIVALQGAHSFKRISNRTSPQRDRAIVSRKLKNIDIEYSIDLWDATSNSARGVHLAGRKSVMSLAKITSIESTGHQLKLSCSAIAIGSGFDSLKTRDYSPYSGLTILPWSDND